MRKLKLQMEDLEVVSFAIDGIEELRGTVDGHKPAPPTEEPTCIAQPSCDPAVGTCNYAQTCYNSCDFCGTVQTVCFICVE